MRNTPQSFTKHSTEPSAQLSTKPDRYYAGFDYLRAILSLAVIAIHTNLLTAHGKFSLEETGINIFDIIQFNLFFLAVPVFLLISLFLFYKKNGTLLKDGRRIYQLVILYVFWTSIWILFKDTRPRDGIYETLIFLMRGGKSIFWFFFSLTFTTALAAVTRKLSPRLTWIALCISLFVIALFPILNMADPAYQYLVAFWNPLGFIPYVFAARLFVYYENIAKSHRSIQLILLVTFIALCCIEWLTLIHPNHRLVQFVEMPIYSRVSVAIGASLLFIAALKIQSSPPRFIQLLSASSLGLYCTHPFLVALTSGIKTEVVGLQAITYFLAITAASLALTYILKQVFQARLI